LSLVAAYGIRSSGVAGRIRRTDRTYGRMHTVD
jgi:hypothetical protein